MLGHMPDLPLKRDQAAARREADAKYKFPFCAVCGLQIATCMMVAHLDHVPTNNDPDNLAFLCQTHHWMYDCDLYPKEGIKLLRDHWQLTLGVASHAARMKDAGARAAATRKRGATARRAWATRRAQEIAPSAPSEIVES